MERMTILHPYGVVEVNDLPAKMAPTSGLVEPEGSDPDRSMSQVLAGMPAMALNNTPRLPRDGLDLKKHLTEIEISLIEQALDECSGVVAHAAAPRWWRRCANTIFNVRKRFRSVNKLARQVVRQINGVKRIGRTVGGRPRPSILVRSFLLR